MEGTPTTPTMRQIREILKGLGRRRRDLGMPIRTLAVRAGVPIRTTERILGAGSRVAFASVLAVADALGMRDLHRGQDILAMRQRQAGEKAEKLVEMVQATSALEAQAVDRAAERRMVARTVAELLKGPLAVLWAP